MHGVSAHPLYAQSLFVEQGYGACACAPPIKHVVTRHARMAAANPMLGISEAVGALYRRGCSCAAPAVTKEWLAGWQPEWWSAASQARNDGVVSAERWRCERERVSGFSRVGALGYARHEAPRILAHFAAITRLNAWSSAAAALESPSPCPAPVYPDAPDAQTMCMRGICQHRG